MRRLLFSIGLVIASSLMFSPSAEAWEDCPELMCDKLNLIFESNTGIPQRGRTSRERNGAGEGGGDVQPSNPANT